MEDENGILGIGNIMHEDIDVLKFLTYMGTNQNLLD